MALARLNRKTEATLKDHNCAFNAFALGLCDERVMRQLESSLAADKRNPGSEFSDFITMTAQAFDVSPTWQSVKEKLLTLRKNDSCQLQKVLARVLRTLSINIARLPAEQEFHYLKTIEPLLSAYNCYSQPAIYGASDDIFARHPFVVETFSRLEDEVSLLSWWKEIGYHQFLEEMDRDRAWAGDLELARLARYFEVVLELARGDFSYMIHGNYGHFPRLEGEAGSQMTEDEKVAIKRCLYNRDIIRRGQRGARHDDADEFVLSGLGKIIRRLEAVPQFEAVKHFIDMHAGDLKGRPIPANWSQPCREELIQRSVICRHGDKFCFSAMDVERVLEAVSAIPCLPIVKGIFKSHYVSHPLMVLSNENGEHWENTLALPTHEERLLQRMGFYAGPHQFNAVSQMLAADAMQESAKMTKNLT